MHLGQTVLLAGGSRLYTVFVTCAFVCREYSQLGKALQQFYEN